MSSFVNGIDELLKEKGLSRNKMLSDLGLNKNSMNDWSKRGTIPKATVVSAIAEYLGVPISILLGENDEPEKFISFSEKLSFLMRIDGIDEKLLAKKLKLPETTIIEWISGKNDVTYEQYIDDLSSIFKVHPKYWLIEGVVPPGIEPNTEEYLLILLYREYKETGILKEDVYGPLEHYFPGIPKVLTGCNNIKSDDSELLDIYHQLPLDAQIGFKGEMKGYLKAIKDKSISVAAEKTENISQAK